MIKIDLLKNHPDIIPQLATIWYEVLGKIWAPEVPLEHTVQRFHTHLNDDELPLTMVAFDDNKPVGMGSLRNNDGIRPELSPWLGSLVVAFDYQKQGIGKLLINAIKHKAIHCGFERLYLFAFDPSVADMYRRLGWQNMGVDQFKNYPVTVMEMGLGSTIPFEV